MVNVKPNSLCKQIYPDSFGCLIYDMIYLSTAIGLTLGCSSTEHIYTWTIHRTTQITTEQDK